MTRGPDVAPRAKTAEPLSAMDRALEQDKEVDELCPDSEGTRP